MLKKAIILSFLAVTCAHIGFFAYRTAYRIPARPHLCTHENTAESEYTITITTADEETPQEIGYVRYQIITEENYPEWFDEAGFQRTDMPLCYIAYINVAPEFQKEGWGKYLMHQAQEQAHNNDCSALVWMSFNEAVGFYEKLGAQKVGSIINQTDGNPLPTMQLRLA